MLDIVLSCNPVQYQGKVMMKTWENGKNSNFGIQIFFHESYLYELDTVPGYHPMQLPRKLMNRIWEIGKKPKLGPNFGPFSWNLGVKKIFGGFYLNL